MKAKTANVYFYADYVPSANPSGSSYMLDSFPGLHDFININTNMQNNNEWKCPACGTINPIEATVCGEKHERAIGCGHPREKTRQEMYG